VLFVLLVLPACFVYIAWVDCHTLFTGSGKGREGKGDRGMAFEFGLHFGYPGAWRHGLDRREYCKIIVRIRTQILVLCSLHFLLSNWASHVQSYTYT
jgi:hypothetical protein